MAQSLSLVSDLTVEDVHFPSSVVPPGSSHSLFLGGAGVRGLEIDGRFVKFTSIGVYLEESAIESLAATWKGKAADELFASGDFFMDVVKGPFEKFTRVSMILPLTGQQYSDKVAENCEKYWKAIGIHTEKEAAALEKFKAAFKDQTFPPGAAILFTQSPSGSLTIAFSKDGSMIPNSGNVVIENKALSEAVLESIIGQHGVSPLAKKSLASRVSDLLKEFDSQNAQVESVN